MIKSILKRQLFCVILLVSAVFFFQDFSLAHKQNNGIILKDEAMSFVPKEFYIDSVNDERPDRNAIAWILPSATTASSSKPYAVDLQGGGLPAITRFLNHNLPVNKKLHPIAVSIKEFKATESSASTPGRVDGHITLMMAFYLERGDAGKIHLLDYHGNATYNRTAGPPQEIEPSLRHLLVNGMVYLNTWMNQQAGTNIKLAKAVKINFTDYEESPEGDSIYYSAKRPLKWDDFQSKIAASRYDAEVFPTIGYDEHTEVNGGIINVTLAIKVVLPKSAAWARDGSRNDYTLNHEQRHFDIVKIVAERLKQKINSEHLTIANYEGIINFEYLEAYREMTRLQKQYDDETRHGSDRSAQQQWNERIDKELTLGH
jgi:hypothetical protein